MIKKILTYDRLASKPYPLYELLLALPAAGICYVLYDYITLSRLNLFHFKGGLVSVCFASLWASLCFALALFVKKWTKSDLVYLLTSYLFYFSNFILRRIYVFFTDASYALRKKIIAPNGDIINGDWVVYYTDGHITLAGWIEYTKTALQFFIPLVIFLYIFSLYFSAKSRKAH